jgi:hypothetical protein
VVTDWNDLQLRMMLNANPATNVVLNYNHFAYMSVALYEAVHPGIQGSASLSQFLYQMPPMPVIEANTDYNWSVSANAAVASLVRQYFTWMTDANKTSVDSLENAYNQRLRVSMNEDFFNRSQAFGRKVASAVYDWSKSDNFNVSNTGYTPPTGSGMWEPTLPAYAGAIAPFLKDALLFIQANQTVTAPAFPYAYSEDPSSDFYKAVKEVYDISKALTPEQLTMAKWWVDVGVNTAYTASGHIFMLVNQALEARNLNLAQAAAIFAKAGVGLRDGVITLWKIKYNYNMIRPVTYIRRLIDPNWLPAIGTPAHPEYPSAHAYLTAAAMQVLTRELGDNIPFTDNSYTFLGYAPRQYSSFTKVAEECALSRIYGGIHYRASVETGLAVGKKIGDKAADLRLLP